jgi:CARDB
MRWSVRVVLVVGVAAVVSVASVSPALARSGPDLVVSSLAEPPDGVARGGSFQESYTVANQGNRRARRRTTVEFYLTARQRNPRRGDRRLRGRARRKRINRLAAKNELARRIKLRLPASVTDGLYYLVACIDRGRRLREANEGNNCRITGQVVAVGSPVTGPDLSAPAGPGNEARIDRFTLPIGRPTVQGVQAGQPFGDDEKSNQRRTVAQVGPVTVIADCKRTSNGDGAGPDTAPTSANSFDQNGDEAKILVYTTKGTVTFNSMGASSRRNIPPGEGSPSAETGGQPGSATRETTGGEGKHMALAAARDPQQSAPDDDWVFGYKVGTIYVNHSNGTEFIMTVYTGIDVLGVGDNCVYGGFVKVLRDVA